MYFSPVVNKLLLLVLLRDDGVRVGDEVERLFHRTIVNTSLHWLDLGMLCKRFNERDITCNRHFEMFTPTDRKRTDLEIDGAARPESGKIITSWTASYCSIVHDSIAIIGVTGERAVDDFDAGKCSRIDPGCSELDGRRDRATWWEFMTLVSAAAVARPLQLLSYTKMASLSELVRVNLITSSRADDFLTTEESMTTMTTHGIQKDQHASTKWKRRLTANLPQRRQQQPRPNRYPGYGMPIVKT
uniref:Uncharacterized protein n=1 Tax=Pristionchus pacificus TaxID=54126 RepID=A0A2A6B4X6_PRIPA|eukprot:PDM60930.1 hypothetical protein PRIPAC_54736 [Pristionchus pacificus]